MSGELCQVAGLDPDDWFARPGTPVAENARKLCYACPLQVTCRAYALDKGVPAGIWGGMDELERRDEWIRLGAKPAAFFYEINAAVGLAEFRKGAAA